MAGTVMSTQDATSQQPALLMGKARDWPGSDNFCSQVLRLLHVRAAVTQWRCKPHAAAKRGLAAVEEHGS